MKKTRTHIILQLFLLTIIITSITGSCSSIVCNENNTPQKQQFDLAFNAPQATDKNSREHVSRKKRMRKPSAYAKATADRQTTQKRKWGSTYLDMDYEELLAAKNVQVERNNIPVAIKYLDQLMKLCNDITRLAEHLLQMADLYFLDKQFQKAMHLYTQYCSLYPGSEKQEYALYRSIISSFACILSIDRDQTKTEDTLALTELFLKQDHFIHYKDEVMQIQMQCYKQLAASECNICNFYLVRGKLNPAEKRLKKIRSYWLPKIPTLEPDIIALEAQLTEQRDMITALNNPTATLAHNRKKHMSRRF